MKSRNNSLKVNRMKKIIVFCFLLIIGNVSYAQHISLGLKVGNSFFNLKTSSNIPGAKFMYGAGFDLGLLANMSFHKHLGIQIEPSLTDKNLQITRINQFRFRYYSLPIYLKFLLSKSLSLLAGPELEYNCFTDNVQDFKFLYTSKMNIGLGMGLSLLFGDRFYLAAKYSYGLSPISSAVIYINGGNEVVLTKLYHHGFVADFGFYIFK
jgi:hypothetical protein